MSRDYSKQIEAMRLANTGRELSEDHKQAISNTKKNVDLKEAHRKAISEAMKRKKRGL